MQDKRLCKYCIHKGTDWCDSCGTDEDNNTLFEPKCCENCDWGHQTCHPVNKEKFIVCGNIEYLVRHANSPQDFCSKGKAKEE